MKSNIINRSAQNCLSHTTLKYFRELVRLMRPAHWVKNMILFFPLFFVGNIFHLAALLQILLGFISFSLMASAIYILNDIADVNSDRNHPIKRKRPIASGSISKNDALLLAGFLTTFSIIIAAKLSILFLALVVGYLLQNILYSWKLKKIAYVDISIITLGFVMRVFSGGVLSETPISIWLILMTTLMSLLLAVGKRKYDLQFKCRQDSVKCFFHYDYKTISILIPILIFSTILSYISYTLSSPVVQRIGSNLLVLSTIPVLIGFWRYARILYYSTSSSDPIQILRKDSVLQTTILVWVTMFYGFLYF